MYYALEYIVMSSIRSSVSVYINYAFIAFQSLAIMEIKRNVNLSKAMQK